MNKTTIVHVCNDSLFNEFIIDQFEQVNPSQNIYLVLTEKIGSPLKFSHPKITTLTRKEVKKFVFNNSIFILHSLFHSNLWFLSVLPKRKTIAWFSWGADLNYLGSNNDETKNLEPITLQHQQKLSSIKNKFYALLERHTHIHKWFYFLRNGNHHPLHIKAKSLSKVDFISTVLPQERPLLNHLKTLKATYVEYNYGYIDHLIRGYSAERDQLSKGVYVGHASFYSNNQIDVLHKLHSIAYNGDILCPISYGEKECANVIKDLNKQLFDNRINTLSTIIPYLEFTKLLASNHVMVLNTIHQQGVGNLLMGLYMGMKVFLNEKGLLFMYCKSLGLKVYSFQKDFNSTTIEDLQEMDLTIKNRKILDHVLSKKVVLQKTLNIVNLLYHTQSTIKELE
ncbi:hypothetical protein BFP72_14940 [Reichenbachiella sp. 5M10]|uniref:hypothetical protein n=1 Tax=Reichenbachiella sp. 5M10 TaxID=1889772 RepID=UPI000C14C694|nr:hypothetical protein [Reichenbachiella sp. 5M10]PIB36604.1 hypothetical protein BFP72_14940 [Reichenbachiella sp. 5M10]